MTSKAWQRNALVTPSIAWRQKDDPMHLNVPSLMISWALLGRPPTLLPLHLIQWSGHLCTSKRSMHLWSLYCNGDRTAVLLLQLLQREHFDHLMTQLHFAHLEGGRSSTPRGQDMNGFQDLQSKQEGKCWLEGLPSLPTLPQRLGTPYASRVHQAEPKWQVLIHQHNGTAADGVWHLPWERNHQGHQLFVDYSYMYLSLSPEAGL